VWGSKYIELFKNTCLKSFTWPDNLTSLLNEDVTWVIKTKEEDLKQIKELTQTEPLKNFKVQIDPITSSVKHAEKECKRLGYPGLDWGMALLFEFIKEMQICLKTDSKLLMAPPDSLYGDGSLKNLFKLGRQSDICVAVPHPRVLPDILNDLPSRMTNAQLVKKSFDNLHTTINTRIGGVLWRKMDEDLYAVQHHLPTPYLLHFTEEDLNFYKHQITFGVIDHTWMSVLVPKGRVRHVTSSDLCFICEVTPACQNVCASYPYLDDVPDFFWRKAEHNNFFKQIHCTFRGE
jgi:hypothetical protein